MSVFVPNVNEIGERMIKCPECGEIHYFKIFYTNISVTLGGYSILPLKRKYTTLCPGCKELFTLAPETGDAYLINRDTPIAATNLRKRKNKDA